MSSHDDGATGGEERDETDPKPISREIAALGVSPPKRAPVTRERNGSGSSAPSGLDSFATGNSNRRAFRAVREAVREPGDRFNPLLLVGPAEVGKTHLLQSAIDEAKELHDGWRCVYLSADQFHHRFVRALRNQDLRNFRRTIRHTDVLALDGIDSLAGKKTALQELQYTIDDLMGHHRQFIASSKSHPKEIRLAPDALVDRLLGQMVVKLETPDEETRTEILRAWCEKGGVEFPEEVFDLLVRWNDRGLAELQGAFQTLAAHVRHEGDLDVEDAWKLLKELEQGHAMGIPTMGRIAQVVADHHEIDEKVIFGRSRKVRAVRPRQIAIYLSRKITDRSLREIGEFFGGRAASTVSSSLDRIEQLQEDEEEDIARRIEEIRANL